MDALAAAPPRPRLVIQPSSGWAAVDFTELFHYRDLLWTFAVRDIKLRYRQTALGIAWVVAQPLLASGILSFVFGIIAGFGSDASYIALVYAGQLGWQIFNNTVTKNSTLLTTNSHLVSKVYFPRLILPLSTLVSTFIDFIVALVLMAVLLLLFHIHLHAPIFLLPMWIGLLLLLSLGCGLIAGSLMVRYRDVQYIVPVLVQSLMFASPVAYSAFRCPARWQYLYFLNPLASLIEGLRWSLLGAGSPYPYWRYVAYSAVVSITVCIVGAFWFKRMERTFADVI